MRIMLLVALTLGSVYAMPQVQLIRDAIIKNNDKEIDFYGRLTPFASKKKFYVYDEGLGKINVFDNDFRYISSFGRYGNGPGEFQKSPLQTHMKNFFALEKYVFVTRRFRIMVFSDLGDLLVEHPVKSDLYSIYRKNNDVYFESNRYKIKNSRITYKIQLNDVNKLHTQFVRFDTEDSSVSDFYIDSLYSFFIRKPNYNLEINSREKQYIFKRNVEKIALDFKKELEDIYKNDKDAAKREFARIGKPKYLNDLLRIVGVANDYIFLERANFRQPVAKIDVVNFKKVKFVNTLTFVNRKKDEYSRFFICRERLVAVKKSDEDGFYMEIYKIQ